MRILVGGARSSSGKTTLIRIVLRIFPFRFGVVKISPNDRYGEGIEASREVLKVEGKDTFLFLSEPSRVVVWIRGRKDNISRYLAEFFGDAEGDFLIEGNSYISYSDPDKLIFVEKEGEELKEQSRYLKEKANLVVVNTRIDCFELNGITMKVNLRNVLDQDNEVSRSARKHIAEWLTKEGSNEVVGH